MSNRRIVVLGGTLSGPTAAARAREIDESADITIIQSGARLGFAFAGLAHYLSGEVADLSQLDHEGEAYFRDVYNIKARLNCQAVALDRHAKTLTLRNNSVSNSADQSMQTLAYDRLIFALGARSIELAELSGPNVSSLRHVEDARRMRAAFAAGERSFAVIGGGSFGLEAVDGLLRMGAEVTLIERNAQLLPRFSGEIERQLHRYLKDRMKLHCQAEIISVEKDPSGRLRAVQLSDGKRVLADQWVVCAGVQPRTELLKAAGIALQEDGAVPVDAIGRIAPDIYACGASVAVPDAITGKHRWWAQAAIADKLAQVCGENAAGLESRVQPSTGSFLLRVGGLQIGRVGLDQHEAHAAFADHELGTSLIPGHSHESYFPGNSELSLELLWHRPSGRLIGAQAIGGNDVDKRIDVLASAIVGKLTVEQLRGLDLGYAGAFNATRDVINHAGYLAEATRNGLGATISVDALAQQLARVGVIWHVIDVRDAAEADLDFAGANVHRVAFSGLREHLKLGGLSLSKDSSIVVLSKNGRRAWQALRILHHHEFSQVLCLSGGATAWSHRT